MSPQIYCLGEPLVEFNQQPDGLFKTGFGGDVSNVAVAAARLGAQAGVALNDVDIALINGPAVGVLKNAAVGCDLDRSAIAAQLRRR